MKRKNRYLKILMLAAVLSLACTTRVSEWVLLNAEQGQYRLVYYYSGNKGESVSKQHDVLRKELNGANIMFSELKSPNTSLPYYALIYENRLFSRYSGIQELTGLASSPLRKKIAADLMAGNLCVLLYLETGNQEKDSKGLEAIKKTLEVSPFGGIVTVVQLNRNNIAEKHFISMLLNVEDDLKGINEPMLFGIFGKFKALEPLVSKGISVENIDLMLGFLTADCSCLIKEDLPGTDILFAGIWDEPEPALVNKILDEHPELQHH